MGLKIAILIVIIWAALSLSVKSYKICLNAIAIDSNPEQYLCIQYSRRVVAAVLKLAIEGCADLII